MSNLTDIYRDLLAMRREYIHAGSYELGNNIIAFIKDSFTKDLPRFLDYHASDLIRDGSFSGMVEYNIDHKNRKLVKDADANTTKEYNKRLTDVLTSISPFNITVNDTKFIYTRSRNNVKKVMLKLTVAFISEPPVPCSNYHYKSYTLEEINQEMKDSAEKIRQITNQDFQVEPITDLSNTGELSKLVSKFIRSPNMLNTTRLKCRCAYYIFRVLSKVLFIYKSHAKFMKILMDKVDEIKRESNVDLAGFVKPDCVIPEVEEFIAKNKL
jgi:hypothetical protein